jgi:hypothetical protein
LLLARGVDFKLPQRTTAQAAAAFNQRRFGKIFGIQQFSRVGTLQLAPWFRGRPVRSGENDRS